MSTVTEEVQLCIFDIRRGQQEGQELDKILFFYPLKAPVNVHYSVLGLCEGIITFTRKFSDADCEVIESEKQARILYQVEPDIWMVLVVDNSKENESAWRCAALQGVLKEVYSLFTMFYGPIRALLDKQPSGQLARSNLHSFVPDYLSDYNVGKRIQMPTFRDSLKEKGTVPMLTVSRDAALEVQSLITALGSSVGNTASYSLLLFQDLLVSTTLPPDDTATVYTYAALRLTPHALSSSANSPSYIRRWSSASHTSTASSLANDGAAIESLIHNLFRPMRRDFWSKRKDGFICADSSIKDSSHGRVTSTPILWLRQTDEHMHLCTYQHNNLTILLLVSASSIKGDDGLTFIKNNLREIALEKIQFVEQKLSRGWGGENAYHVSKYRYLLVDTDRMVSRATPPGKVTTLTKESLLALNRLREEVDAEKLRADEDDPAKEKDLEVCLRAKNNAWVIARLTRGRELYMVLEKASDTLLSASTALEKFNNRYCDGAFSTE